MEVHVKKVVYSEEHQDESAQWIKRLIERILVSQIAEDPEIQAELLKMVSRPKLS